jgi:hypothetical protein
MMLFETSQKDLSEKYYKRAHRNASVCVIELLAISGCTSVGLKNLS